MSEQGPMACHDCGKGILPKDVEREHRREERARSPPRSPPRPRDVDPGRPPDPRGKH